MDRKLEVLTRSIQSKPLLTTSLTLLALTINQKVYEDPSATTTEEVQSLEQENEELRRRLAMMEREFHSRSPTKKRSTKKAIPAPLTKALPAVDDSDVENTVSLFGGMKDMQVNGTVAAAPTSEAGETPGKTPAKTPGKKQR